MISPPINDEEGKHRRALAQAARSLIDGHGNNAGSAAAGTGITIASGATSTVVTDPRVGTDSIIVLMPTTAAAATEYGSGSLYVSARGDGTFTVTSSNTAAERLFDYAILATGHSA